MRVLISLPGLHRVHRGAEVALESIASGLARSGHEVTVYGSGPDLDRPYTYRRIPLVPRERFERWPTMPMLREASSYEGLTFNVGVARRFRPGDHDVTLTCGFPWDNLVLRRPARGTRPAHVFVTENGDYPAQMDRQETRLFDADGLVCTNPVYLARNQHRYRSALIPNGVDTERFSPGEGSREALGLPVDVPLVLTVAALSPNKRVDDAIRAVAPLDDAVLVVAGAGPLGPELDALAALEMPGRLIRRTFDHDQMPDLYRSVDVLLHPTRFESFGNIYIEAMASGLPVVAHRSEVTEWILGDSELLVDAADHRGVAATIEAVLDGRAGPSRDALVATARAEFSWSAVVSRYDAFLTEVVG